MMNSSNGKKRSWKPVVYIASPFSGDEKGNTEKAIRYCRFAVDRNAIPVAPHLYLPRFMSEATERDKAMFMNMVFLGKCEQLWVFGEKITEGMTMEIARAMMRGIPIRYFTEECEERANGHTQNE